VKRYFSLVAKWLLAATGLMLFCLSGLQAGGFISGADLRGQLNGYLAKHGLTGEPVLNNARQFRACMSDLHFSPLFGNFQTIEIRCPDADGWKIAVRTKLGASAMSDNIRRDPEPSPDIADKELAVVVNKRLTKNSIIGPGDVGIEPITAKASGDYFTQIDDVIGRRVKRSLRPRQIVETRHLQTDWMIEKGQPVVLESGIGAIQVLSAGIALDNAQWGELARFLNIRSEKEVFGKVVSEKKVIIRAKTFQK
jgi:flagella basal body P-ring formation protein FlgA